MQVNSSKHFVGLQDVFKTCLEDVLKTFLQDAGVAFLSICWGCLSKLYWASFIISIAETASKKTGAFIHFIKSLSPEVALYLCKSTIRSCMEYCCYVWDGAPSCYLEMLDKLQKKDL